VELLSLPPERLSPPSVLPPPALDRTASDWIFDRPLPSPTSDQVARFSRRVQNRPTRSESSRLGSARSPARLRCRLGSVLLFSVESTPQAGQCLEKKRKRGLMFCFLGFLGNYSSLPRRVLIKKNLLSLLASMVLLRFRHRLPLLILRSRRRHGFFFDFFRLRLSLAISCAFRWYQLS
jgi:hypothetical protein